MLLAFPKHVEAAEISLALTYWPYCSRNPKVEFACHAYIDRGDLRGSKGKWYSKAPCLASCYRSLLEIPEEAKHMPVYECDASFDNYKAFKPPGLEMILKCYPKLTVERHSFKSQT